MLKGKQPVAICCRVKRESELFLKITCRGKKIQHFCRNESVRKSSLFDDMDEVENDETNKENHSNEFWHFKKYC